MIKRNIWNDVNPPLELHKDFRGKIVDVVYKNNINHIAVIVSNKGALRGNHYHKKSIQHILMIHGSMEYWFKPLNSKKPVQHVILKRGDIVTSPPNEIHALRILERNTEFIALTSGLRGGHDYESDTFRVPSIFPENKILKGF